VTQQYEAIIGLEVHVELNTRTKIFCSCPVQFGAEPNTVVCPVCLGLPGVLPVLNRRAVEHAVTAALALGCRVRPHSRFHRKNYFYPDVPKDYQITQYDLPLGEGGRLEIEGADDGSDDGSRSRPVGIRRVHLEEDAGKSIHGAAGGSLVDFNRAGVPLVEIVTEPDIRSPGEARRFLEELRLVIRYSGVSDVKMEEGSLRCDANISVHPRGSEAWGTLTEVKNMNSFRAVKLALEYEMQRQIDVLEGGGRVVRETRHWDESRGVTLPARSKEEAHDYRYFPEPDLPPLELDEAFISAMGRRLPELPAARRRRYREGFGLSAYDAAVLTASPDLALFFEAAAGLHRDAKQVANWVMGDYLRALGAAGRDAASSPVRPEHLAELLGLIDEGKISGRQGKVVIEEMCATGRTPAEVVAEKGLVQISDEGRLLELARRVVADNPEVVRDFRGGKEKALGFLVGQVMKLTRGQANPRLAGELLRRVLAERRNAE